MRDALRVLAIAACAVVLVVGFYHTVFWWQKLTWRAAEAEQAKINQRYKGGTAEYQKARDDLWAGK